MRLPVKHWPPVAPTPRQIWHFSLPEWKERLQVEEEEKKKQASKALEHDCAPAYNLFIDNRPCLQMSGLGSLRFPFFFMIHCIFRVLSHGRKPHRVTSFLANQGVDGILNVMCSLKGWKNNMCTCVHRKHWCNIITPPQTNNKTGWNLIKGFKEKFLTCF